MSAPNVVLIHWHDTGVHLPSYGFPAVPAPNVTAFAEESVVFERAFATAPLCSPARGSLFTGRYPHSNGLMGLAHLGWEYHVNERPLPLLLADAGYRSVLVGLQHESSDPSTLGYDEVDDLNAACQYAPAVAELATVRLRRLAAAGQPFALTVGMFEPHRPFPPELYPPVDPALVTVPGHLPDTAEVRADLAGFYGSIAVADAATGRILDTLTELGLDESTVVVFTTDHGIPFPGAKSTLHDAGVQVGLIVRVPGVAGGRADRLVSHVDVVPTLLDLVGVEVPAAVQGVSFADRLGGGGGPVRTAVYSEKNWHDPDQYDPVRSVRTDRYRLIESWEDRPRSPIPGDVAEGGSVHGLPPGALGEPRPRIELYDLREDPYEQHDLAPDPGHAAVRDEHRRLLLDWQRETADPLLDGPIEAPRVRGSLSSAIVGRATRVPLGFRQKGGPAS
jgi:arylsulfatase A-like enzyme